VQKEKTKKVILSVLKALLILVLLVYGINLFDEDIDHRIERAEIFSDGPTEVAGNLAFAMYGLTAPVGNEIAAWGGLKHTIDVRDVRSRMLGVERKKNKREDSRELSSIDISILGCKEYLKATCRAQYVRHKKKVAHLRKKHRIVLERYASLNNYTFLREPRVTDWFVPIISYHVAVGANRIESARIAIIATNGHRQEAIRKLGREIKLWRMVLAQSRSVIGKMVAINVLDRAIMLASEITRDLGLSSSELKQLYRLLLPLEHSEYDMREAFYEEWRSSYNSFGYIFLDDDTELLGFSDNKVLAKVQDFFIRPLFQLNATLNTQFEDYIRTEKIGAQNGPEFLKSLEKITSNEFRDQGGIKWHWIYNPTGKILNNIGGGPYLYVPYKKRIHDLDIRLTLVRTQIVIKQKRMTSKQISKYVNKITNPVTGKPIKVNLETRVITTSRLGRTNEKPIEGEMQISIK